MSQVIPIAILPFLTRIVPAAQLGTYFVWFGAVSVLTVIATARLDMAVFVARTEEEVRRLLHAVLAISVGVGATALVGAFYYESLSSRPLLTGGADDFTLAWSALACLMAINQTIIAVFVYRANFRGMAVAKVALAAVVSVSQLVACWIFPSVAALVYAQLVATLLVTGFLLYRLVAETGDGFGRLSLTSIGETVKRHYRFPTFAMPSDFINVYAAQLPLFLIAARFGEVSVAFYALTLRVLAGPIGLLAGSVLTVFKERAGRDYRNMGNCLDAYRHAFLSLSVMAILPFTALFFLGEEVFVLVFGSDWAQAGRIAEVLSPMFFMKFIASPLSYTLYIAHRQLHDLVWQIVLLAMTWAVFNLSGSLESAVLMYSGGYSFLYVAYLAISYNAAHGVEA